MADEKPITHGFSVTFETNVEDVPKHGEIARGISLYSALWHLTGPFTEIDGAFVETGFRHLPTHAGKLTQKRTLHLPEGVSASSACRIRRYMLKESNTLEKP